MPQKTKAAAAPFTPTRYSRLVAVFFTVVTISELGWLEFWKGNAPTGWGIWVFGDWLWNFGGGFVRRGLGGEIVLTLHRITGIPVINLLHLLLMAMTVAFNLACYRLIRHRFSAEALLVKPRGAKKASLQRPAFALWLAVLSPMAFAYQLVAPIVVGHKELLVFLLFLWWLRLLKLQLPKRQVIWFALAVAAVELTNEMLLFFSVYFVAAFVFTYQDRSERVERLRQVRLPIIALAVSAAAAIAFSTNSSRLDMCNRLLANGTPEYLCVGPLEWAGSGVAAAFAELKVEIQGTLFVETYAGALLLALLPLFLLVRKTVVSGFARRWMLICFIGVLPMFVVAQDWGRWVSMHAVLATLLTLGLLLPAASPSKLVSKPRVAWITRFFDWLVRFLDGLPAWIRYPLLLLWLCGWGVLHYGALASSIWSVLRGNSFDFWLQPRGMQG